jgi:hypothetical protein
MSSAEAFPIKASDHTASEHRFGFECFASTGLNTPVTMSPTINGSLARRRRGVERF